MDDFVVEVLRVMAEGDARDDLFWSVKGDDVSFFINCSDFFWWGTSDLEEIVDEEDVQGLRQALSDARSASSDGGYPAYWWQLLWCARKRGMRPQTPYFRGHMAPNPNNREGHTYPDVFRSSSPYNTDSLTEEQRALFDACGPERTDA